MGWVYIPDDDRSHELAAGSYRDDKLERASAKELARRWGEQFGNEPADRRNRAERKLSDDPVELAHQSVLSRYTTEQLVRFGGDAGARELARRFGEQYGR